MTPGLTMRHRPGELPVEVTGFVGRQREVAELAGLLRTARLVTVIGPGGVGKTRVALRVAAACADVCFVQLSGLRDADLLPNVVATCLGLPEAEARSQLDAIVDYLRERRLLLILDTCEHVLDACAMFADILLRAATSVTVLATSRQPLDVPGEHALLLKPMPAEAAVELFAQCAAAIVPGFAVTDANRADVRVLCSWLDGVPLAIELAAVRLRALPLPQLAGRLGDRFRLLTGGRRAALAHHRTLLAATEWSYDLCTPAEQLLWARLSVFAGSFDIDAAEEICAGQPLAREDTLATLIGLVDKSVVQHDEDRYRLLDTIREFGAEKLGGEAAVVRGRHIGHYLAMAARFGDHPLDDDQLPRYRQLRREHANLRAALGYALAAPGRARDAARMATALFPYWHMSGGLREGRYWLAKALDRLEDPSSERAWALVTGGFLAALAGEPADGIPQIEAGLAMTDEPLLRSRGHVYLNMALAEAGRYAEADAGEEIADEFLRAADDTIGLTMQDVQVGYLRGTSGRLDESIARARQGLDRLGPASGDRWMHGYLYAALGLSYFLRGDHPESAAALARGLAMKRDIGDIRGIAYLLEGTAWLAVAQQRHTRAAWLLGAADTLWQLAGTRLGGNVSLDGLHARAEQAARQELGSDRYDALYRRGAERPHDEIIQLTLHEADELTGPPAAPAPAQSPLTSRESEIAALVAEGLPNREIAERLVISKRTVDAHIEHIFSKLGLSSRIQLVNWLQAEPSERER
jgi:predicted ATPase/DNA-binding CsgD family transcriptional regulator